ncbi:MAG TPA: glycosyltransferase family 4 protein [bacterium]|nr:glycosyltransferase family 4 protein [bacterium]HQP97201.1 glycosyltransferase family 4 protein [bacterium]
MTQSIALIHRAGWGGAEQTLLDLIAGLPGEEWRVTATVLKNRFSRNLAALNVNVELMRKIPAWRKGRDFIACYVCTLGMVGMAQRICAKVIIAGDIRTAPFAIRAALNLKIPSLVFIQDSTIEQRHIMAYRVDEADRVLCPSNRQLQHTIQGGVDPSRAILLPVGIDTDRFNPNRDGSHLRSQWKLRKDAVLVGCIGSMSSLKGQDLLLDAMLSLMQEDKRIQLILVGSGKKAFIRELTEQADEFLSNGRVRFVDWMDDVEAAYSAVDVVAVPSWSESFSRVTAEAMACGKAVVATQTGAVEELFDGDRCGISVPVGEDSPMQEALARLVNDAELRVQLGHAASERIASHFPLAKSQEQFRTILQSICS